MAPSCRLRRRAAAAALLASVAAAPAAAAPGLQTPVMGYSNWNSFANNINASLFRETATFMKQSGLLAAGYNYVTLGGIGYANGSTNPAASKGHGRIQTNITRNGTGYLQVDPVRFPGGNEGMRALAAEIRSMGFKWGHCEPAAFSRPFAPALVPLVPRTGATC